MLNLLRCLQHPYLVSREIEPKGLSAVEAHEKLIWASAKLRLLQTLLPKLKARGHRVLLFSQVRYSFILINICVFTQSTCAVRHRPRYRRRLLDRGKYQIFASGRDLFAFLKTSAHVVLYRMVIQSRLIARKTWMNSTNLIQMCSSIS